MNNNKRIVLPCLRGKIGDWMYYVTLLNFKEIANRVSMVPKIHKSEKLSKLIQREVTNRSHGIVDYLKSQDQRFFNSLILGVYGGRPEWHEIGIEDSFSSTDDNSVPITEVDEDNINSTLGALVLNGNESIFAIDGQHRTKAIKDAIKEKKELSYDEIPVILVAHKKSKEGEMRTRRLFSTLNRYAKPVNKSEIIAIDEEDNGAIITRMLLENYNKLKNGVSFNKIRSISLNNTKDLTNIIVLYDFIVTILSECTVYGVKTKGKNYKQFTHRRDNDETIDADYKFIVKIFNKLFKEIPVFKNYLKTKSIDRKDTKSSLLFRPVGQNVLYSILKVAIDKDKFDKAVVFFAKNDFSLENPIWSKIFTDSETGRMKTDKSIQKFAFQLILENLEISISHTEKDKEIFRKFNIDTKTLEFNQ